MKFYTLFENGKLFENVIDDMNTTETWGQGGMIWTSKEVAQACVEYWKGYDKFLDIVELEA